MILDCHLADPAADADGALAALQRACAAAEIAVEHGGAPWNGEPGRMYLAIRATWRWRRCWRSSRERRGR